MCSRALIVYQARPTTSISKLKKNEMGLAASKYDSENLDPSLRVCHIDRFVHDFSYLENPSRSFETMETRWAGWEKIA
jgi:hypothetical protein